MLGWEPRVNLVDGLQQTIRYFREARAPAAFASDGAVPAALLRPALEQVDGRLGRH